MSVQERRKLSNEDRREQLLEAALRAFGRGGYDATHVSHIVEEAGVARGTFYLHFKSKHEVFEALVDRMLSIFLAVRPLDPIPVFSSLEDVETLLRRHYEMVLGTFHQHRRLARLLFDEAIGIGKRFREKLEAHYRAWHERIAALLELAVETGVARRDLDVEVTGELVIGMVERVARRFLFHAGSEVDLDRYVDAIVAFELSGIRACRAGD